MSRKPAEGRNGSTSIAQVLERIEALRQAAVLPGAEPVPLLTAALAELRAAAAALTAGNGEQAAGPSDVQHAERRLLHAVFQQVPVPVLLLGLDGTIRRANAEAAALLGSGSGYATGKPLTAFVDLPSRAAAQTQLAAVTRTGEPAQIACALLTAAGPAEHLLSVRPVAVRGDSGQLLVTIGRTGARPAGHDRQAPTGRTELAEPAIGLVESMTRRLDLVTAATRILLENISYSESVAVAQYARLLATEFGSWVIIDVERRQRLRRQVVAGGHDQRSEELARLVTAVDPEPGTAASQVHESGISLLMAHGEDAGVLGTGADGVPLLMALGVTSVLCVPLSDGERRYGSLTLARDAAGGLFGMSDVGLVEELGEQLALAIRLERLFRQRTEIADALQASLLPRQVRQIPGAEIAATHVTATAGGEIGGDFYDVYPARSGWGIAIGDVCGKGEDAAAVTAAARHAIRALAHRDSDPADVLRGANDIMLAEEFGGRFVTANVCHLRWQPDGLRVVSASAGHPAPVLIRPDGRTQILRGGGLPLGIFADAEPMTQELSLDPGDVLFFMTDGLIGACGPDMVYFENKMIDELAALAGQNAAEMVARMRAVVLEFCRGDLRDDLSMLAIRVGEPPAG